MNKNSKRISDWQYLMTRVVIRATEKGWLMPVDKLLPGYWKGLQSTVAKYEAQVRAANEAGWQMRQR